MEASGGLPDGKQFVYLARHGRTDLNARGLLRGHLDPDLDGAGRDEALRLARAFATSELGLVVSSPLGRAVQTAEVVASPHGLVVRIDSRLADRDYDRWAGWTIEEIETRWGSVDDAPGVEPLEEVRARSLAALDELRDPGCPRCLVVSHDAVNRAVLCALDLSRCRADRVSQPTGCVNVLEWNGESWSVLAVGMLPHLDGLGTPLDDARDGHG